jgi:toxin-antitoxin system PIN domain toxin
VIVPDLNLLIYAIDTDSPAHERALRWWEGSLSGTETVGLAWTVLLGFLRITTNPRIVRRPLTADEALDYVDRWLAHPLTVTLEPGERHALALRDLVRPTGTAGNLVTDAHLAALAIGHGARLATADRDFGRFPGLDWFDPLS